MNFQVVLFNHIAAERSPDGYPRKSKPIYVTQPQIDWANCAR